MIQSIDSNHLNWYELSEAEIRQFDDKGYIIVRQALDRETVDRLIEVSDGLIASDRRENRHPRSHDALYDAFRNCIALDDAYIPLLTHQKMLSVVVQLLGAHLQLMTSHLIYKYPDPPGTYNLFWHRDYGGASRVLGNGVPRIMLKCAYYLTDLSEPNSGATLVAPGSNQLMEDIEIPDGEQNPPGFIEPSLQPGDCMVFENRTWHTGSANLSGRTRKCIMFGYGYRWVRPIDYRVQSEELLNKLDTVGRYLVGEPAQDTPEYRSLGAEESPLAAWCDQHGAPAVRPF